MIYDKLILVKAGDNSRNNNTEANNGKTNSSRIVKKVKVDILISISRIPILISF